MSVVGTTTTRGNRHMPPHGTAARYAGGRNGNYKCRCDACRAANTARHLEWAERVKERIPETLHGSSNGFTNWGCRCDKCYEAQAKRRAEWRRANATSRDSAHKHGQEWTGAELEILLAMSKKPRKYLDGEIAERLGRTISAVRSARKLAQHDPVFLIRLNGTAE